MAVSNVAVPDVTIAILAFLKVDKCFHIELLHSEENYLLCKVILELLINHLLQNFVLEIALKAQA
ncbi:MAG: hypothetical protein IPH74_04845 [Bacteroidetes bacterium]|nr:hypothetical protein [Bacteroidota bacterium]